MWINIYFILSFILAFSYVGFLYKVFSSWKDADELNLGALNIPEKSISVLIAARNEADNIVSCIRSILDCDYPNHLLELIVVDDHSTDSTAEKINSINNPIVRYFKLEENLTGKKKALSLAISKSNGEILAMTDADCKVSPNWLKIIANNLKSQEIKFLAMPIVFSPARNKIESFQVLDLCALMALTQFGLNQEKFYLANGANMAVKKSAFLEVNGFHGNENYASGDDMFLVHKLAKKNSKSVRFIKSKDAIVETKSQETFKQLNVQRKRWATKSKAYADFSLQLLLVFIFIFNFSIIINLLVGPFLEETLFFIGLFQLFIKGIIDYLFLENLTKYFDRSKELKYFFSASLLSMWNIIYSAYCSIFIKNYHWKNREAR